jgi:hypothetical protein
MKELFMTLLNPESLSWVDQLEALRALGPTASRADCKKALNVRESQITILNNLDDCFDPAAIEKVRQAAKGDPPYILSSGNAKALVELKKAKVSDLLGKVHAALDVIFARRLATKQIKALVKGMVSGNPAAEFDPRKKVKPVRLTPEKGLAQGVADAPTLPTTLDLKKVAELLKKAEAEKTLGKETTAQKKLLAYFQTILESTQSKVSPSKKGAQGDSNWVETVYLSWLADVSLIKKIKSKVGKGQSVTKGEKALLWLHKLSEWADWVAKHLFKLLKPILKILHIIWKLLIEALEVLGVLKYIKAVLVIAAFVIFGWFAWEAWRYGPMHPVRLLEPYCFRKTEDANGNNNEPLVQPSPSASSSTPVPQTPISMGLGQSKHVARAVVSTQTYQPSIAWQSSDEDPKVLETEIAALPVNCIVKDYPLTPDEGMHGDMAVSRLQDLTDPDKYTMKIGRDTQKILSVNATTTNLIINYKSTDALGGFVDESGQINRFWEDVIMIHVDEIDVQGKNPSVIYQISLIVSGAKEPLTIQCSTPADLKHLVSTMEYFIRASRLAHDTALAGMPYPNQGLRLNNQCLVEVLWANSPANQAGLKLGDMVWSLEKDALLQPERKNLEAALQALTSGPHTLYIVSPADRDKGLVQMNQDHTNYFNPKRHKLSLQL